MSDQLIRRAVAEFIGVFALCFMGIGSILLTGNIVAIAFAHGLAIGLCVLAVGHISGGHFNPAITAAMLATGRISPKGAGVYVVAQLLGAVAATVVLLAAIPGSLRDGTGLGIPAVGPGFSTGNALVAEIVATFFLVFVVFGTAVDKRSEKAMAGLAIGLSITMGVLGTGPISGAALNPARWFGPAIVDTNLSNFWIWIVGPVIGALLAGYLWNGLLLREDSETDVQEISEGMR